MVAGDRSSEDYLRLNKEQISTAKSGTDVQKRDMRHNYRGKYPHQYNAQRTQKDDYVDSAGIG